MPSLYGAFALAFGVGCGASGSDGAATVGTFSDIYPLMFPEQTPLKCDSCHAMPPNDITDGSLHMGTDKATAYAALVGQASVSKKCNGRPLVIPNQPDMSLLLLKFSDNPPCGERMPLGGPPLTDSQKQLVRTWIAAGAKND